MAILSSGTGGKQVIPPEDVMADVHDIKVQQVPFVQKAGLKLATAVGIVIALVTMSTVYLVLSSSGSSDIGNAKGFSRQ